MKGLVVLQPWAHAIAWSGKDVENRSWRPATNLRTLAIIAGRRVDRGALEEFAEPDGGWPLGKVVAVVTIGGSHRDCDGSCSKWAMPGEVHWQLRNVRPLPEPVPCPGWQGVRNIPAEVRAAVRAQLTELDGYEEERWDEYWSMVAGSALEGDIR